MMKCAPFASPAESATPADQPGMAPLSGPILSLEVGGQRLGLPVEQVVQIVEMVAITPLPQAPGVVAGVIGYHGQTIPVIDLRRRLNLPPVAYTLRTPLVISRVAGRLTALIADTVHGVEEVLAEQAEGPGQIFWPEVESPLALLRGVARLPDGLLLILDLASFLSPEEKEALRQALAGRQEAQG